MAAWSWVGIALGVAALAAAGVLVTLLAAPFEVEVDTRADEPWDARLGVRWLFGLVRADGRWDGAGARYSVALAGRRVPQRPLDRLLRWLATRGEERAPVDWCAWLTRERLAREIPALRAARRRLGDREELRSLGLDALGAARRLLDDLRLRANVHMRVGSEDPFTLGIVAAVGAVTHGVLPSDALRLEPGWDGRPVSGTARFGGRLCPGAVIWRVLQFGLLTRGGRRCLRAAWAWWWYPRETVNA